jgi:hypothetical protein
MTARSKLIGGLVFLTIMAAVRADPGDASDEQRRTGFPQEISRRARPSDTGRYAGYTVGGGAPLRKGDAPLPHEGTWGWDYSGGLFQRRVILGWWHGRRYQSGSGAYRTDAPRILPEVEK